MRRRPSNHARPVIGLILLLLLPALARAVQAQSGENWLLPVTDGRIIVNSLTGGDPFDAVPRMRIELASATDPATALTAPLDVYVASGDVLEAAPGSGYCSVILAGSDIPITVYPDRSTTSTFTAYCLQLPDEENGRKPDPDAVYAPIAYRGVVDVVLPDGRGAAILDVLERARAYNLTESYATQLAVWASAAGLTDEQLAVRLNLDLAAFAPELALLRTDPAPAPTPAPTPPADAAVTDPATGVAATAVADAAIPPASGGATTPAGLIAVPDWLAPIFGPDGVLPLTRNILLLLVGGVALMIVASGGLALLRSRRPTSRSASRSRPARPAGTPPPPAAAPPAAAAPRDPVGPTWSPRAQALLNNRKPTTVVRTSGKPPDPDATGIPDNVTPGASQLPPPSPPGQPGVLPFWPTPPAGIGMTPAWGTPAEVDIGATGALTPGIGETGSLSGFADNAPKPPPRRGIEYMLMAGERPVSQKSLGHEGGLVTRGSIHHQIVLSEPTFGDVSAPHALLRIRNGQITLRDLRSRNGTRVEPNEPVAEHRGRPLYHGAIIAIGRHRFQLDLNNMALVSLDANERGRRRPLGDYHGGEINVLITRRHLQTMVVPSNTDMSTPHLLIRPELGSDENQLAIQVRDLRALNPTIIGRRNNLGQGEGGRYSGRNGMLLTIGKVDYKLRANRGRPLSDLGAYGIESEIYRSNMAEIYRVKDPAGAPYAAKVFDIYQNKREIARRAFDLEMELMKQLGPRPEAHVLQCLDDGIEHSENAPYFVMPLLYGHDLDTIMKGLVRRAKEENRPRHGIALADIKAIYDIVLQAIECLHTHGTGYVHCDIKPSNIFVGRDGAIFLLDLGIVVPRGGKAEFGTTYYSAPEVLALRSGIDFAADVFSLGAILFELLTGRGAKYLAGKATEAKTPDDPHTGDGPNGAADKDPHYWLQKAGPAALDFLDIIRKATDEDPGKRYGTVDEFRAALDAAYARPSAAAALAAGSSRLAGLANAG